MDTFERLQISFRALLFVVMVYWRVKRKMNGLSGLKNGNNRQGTYKTKEMKNMSKSKKLNIRLQPYKQINLIYYERFSNYHPENKEGET